VLLIYTSICIDMKFDLSVHAITPFIEGMVYLYTFVRVKHIQVDNDSPRWLQAPPLMARARELSCHQV
jgi:hypothetical protein